MSNGHARDPDATTSRRRNIDAPDADTDQDPIADLQHTVGNRAAGQLLLAYGGTGVQYSPNGPTGAGGSSTTTTTTKKAAKPPWYQEILDRIADEQQNVVTLSTGGTIGGDALVWMNEIKAVALALDAKDVKATQAAVKILIKDQPTALLPYVISEQLDHEMAARAFALGLAPEAMDLIRYFRRRNDWREPRDVHTHSYREDRALWERVTAEAMAAGVPKNGAAAEHALNTVVPIFTAIALEMSELDPGRVEGDRYVRKDPSLSHLAGPYDQSISEYHLTLTGLVDRLFVYVETCEQMLIDTAQDDLEDGKGTKALDIAKRAHVSIDVAITSVKDRELETTKSKFGKTGSKHFDYFGGKADKARSLGISFFDPKQTEGEEMRATFGDIEDQRGQELAFIERLYGLQKKGGKPTDEAASNEAAIKAMGGHLSLHSNESWRVFLSEKLVLMKKAGVGEAEALEKMLDLIHAYFAAFAVHTPYNIDEFGDNYLTRSFPRTLGGQLLHDCGVYALRIVYMLSLVRKDLHLAIRFVVLPEHVGLVLTGDQGAPADYPTFIIHNNKINKITAKEMSGLRDHWRTHDPAGNPLATPQKLDEEQFMGELAAGLYSTVDAPFKFEDVPDLKAPSIPKLQQKYFDLYHARAVASVITDEPGKTGIKNFESRYAKLSDKSQVLFGGVKRYWNDVAPKIWEKHKKGLIGTLQAAQRREVGKQAYFARRDAYVAELNKIADPLGALRDEVFLEQGDIADVLAKHPKLVAKGARVAPSGRGLTFSIAEQKVEDLRIYIINEMMSDLDWDDPDKVDRIEPPFVKPNSRVVDE